MLATSSTAHLMATIKDVARLAGVGLGTASRVISGRGSVSASAIERVQKAIEQLEFRPSHAARSLLSGSSQMVGVYIPILRGTFYTPILSTIDTELRSNGQHMVVAFGTGSGDERRQAIEGIEFLIERGCDGVVVMSNDVHEDDILALGSRKAKIVLLNRLFRRNRDQCFLIDHRHAGVLAARTFLDKGHREYAVIAGSETALDNIQRIEGFKTELTANGVDPNSIFVLMSDFSPEGGWATAHKLLLSKRPFTALFCANDEMAVGALSYFQHAGIVIPRDVSVLGYDDTESAEFSAPRLTSIHIPWRDVALNGLRWLLNQCYETSYPVQRKYKIAVTWRDSVDIAPTTSKRRKSKTT